MNIFYLDSDPWRAATYHNNAHVIKMILESAQLLSTAHRVMEPGLSARKCYRATHINHPCAVWVRASRENYKWLVDLWVNLNKEWQFRWNHKRNHLSIEKHLHFLYQPPHKLSYAPFEPPPQCVTEACKQPDTVKAYRTYYAMEKWHLADWGRRGTPLWWQ